MSAKNIWALTPVKRSDLVFSSGVGALIRLRNGTNALVAGLREWEDTIPLPPVLDEAALIQQRELVLRSYRIRDVELEHACRVNMFHQPPKAPDDRGAQSREWYVPAIIFPRGCYCTNHFCGTVSEIYDDLGRPGPCPNCDPQAPGKPVKRGVRRMAQFPIFRVCPAGHIDDIQWEDEVKHTENCANPDMHINWGASVRSPRVSCKTCKQSSVVRKITPCTGTKPWIPGVTEDSCTETMQVIERTSVQTYFPQTKSAIYVPAQSGLDIEVLEWIQNNEDLRNRRWDDNGFVQTVVSDLQLAGIDHLSLEHVREHLKYLLERSQDEEHEWSFLEARSHELDVLTGVNKGFIKAPNALLEFSNVDLTEGDSSLFGPMGLFSQVVAVPRLTETRVLDGFSRWEPRTVSPDAGYQLMWGHHRPAQGAWLPAYRAYGEGVLLVLNPQRVLEWINRSQGVLKSTRPKDELVLSHAGTALHSLVHLIMTEISQECGYPLPSLRDRIYDLPDGRIAALIFTAESDSMGTLGGLVQFGEINRLAPILSRAITAARWCSQDPVCLMRETNEKRNQGACCHQCLYLPETSCEFLNSSLDRALLTGNKNRHIPELLTMAAAIQSQP